MNEEKTYAPCRKCFEPIEWPHKYAGYCKKCATGLKAKESWENWLFENRENIKKLVEEI